MTSRGLPRGIPPGRRPTFFQTVPSLLAATRDAHDAARLATSAFPFAIRNVFDLLSELILIGSVS